MSKVICVAWLTVLIGALAVAQEPAPNRAAPATERSRVVEIPHKPVNIELAAKEVLNAVRRGDTRPMLFLLKTPNPTSANNEPIASGLNHIGKLLPQMWPARQQFLRNGPKRVKPLVQPGTRDAAQPLTRQETEKLLDTEGAWGILDVSLVKRDARDLLQFRIILRDFSVTEIGTILDESSKSPSSSSATR